MKCLILAVLTFVSLGVGDANAETLFIKRVANGTDLIVNCVTAAYAGTGVWYGDGDSGNDLASGSAAAMDANGAVVFTHATSSASAACVPSVNASVLVPQVTLSAMSTGEVSGVGAWFGDTADYQTGAGAQVKFQVQPPVVSSATMAVLTTQIHILNSNLSTGYAPAAGGTFLVEAGRYTVVGVPYEDGLTWDVTINYFGEEVWRDDLSSGNFILSASETVSIGTTVFVNANFQQTNSISGVGTSSANMSVAVAFYAESIESTAPQPEVDLYYPETEEGGRIWRKPEDEE